MAASIDVCHCGQYGYHNPMMFLKKVDDELCDQPCKEGEEKNFGASDYVGCGGCEGCGERSNSTIADQFIGKDAARYLSLYNIVI